MSESNGLIINNLLHEGMTSSSARLAAQGDSGLAVASTAIQWKKEFAWSGGG
jgi:hypothetical protein